VTLFLCGDVMTGRGIDQILPHPSKPQLYEPYMRSALGYVEIAERATGPIRRPVDFPYVWGDALAELDRVRPDARIINLETAVTAAEDAWPGKGIHYRMHPANVPCISAAKIDCCVLANNHVLDWGYRGLAETLDALRGAGMRTAGAGRDEAEAAAPAAIELPGKGRVLTEMSNFWFRKLRHVIPNHLLDVAPADRLERRCPEQREDLLARVEAGDHVVVELAGEADPVLGADHFLLEGEDVLVRLEVGVALHHRDQAAHRLAELALGLPGLGGARRRHGPGARLAHPLEDLALVLHVALDGAHQVGDQVVAPLELHVDLRPRVPDLVPQPHQAVVEPGGDRDNRDHDDQPDAHALPLRACLVVLPAGRL